MEIKHDTSIAINPGIIVSVYDTLIVQDSSQLTLLSGSKILIKPGGRVFIGPGAHIDLQGGVIECEPGTDTSIFAYDPRALRGSGELRGARIHWETHAVTDTLDTLAFTNGGTFTMRSVGHPDHKWWIGGQVTFVGSETPYHFGPGLDSILLWNDAIITTTAGAQLRALPNITIYNPASAHSLGSASDSCVWNFRDTANLDSYGDFLASNTTFTNTPSYPFVGWNGILSAYEYSRLRLDSCTIENIHISDALQGAAVHLYESHNPENAIRHSRILRGYQTPESKAGEAVILQPGNNHSMITLACDTIRDGWWSGLTAVHSQFDASSTVIHSNRVGVVSQDLSDGCLISMCVMNHDSEGVAARYYSNVSLGRPYSVGEYGYNRIVDNNLTQLRIVEGSCMIGGVRFGGVRMGGENNISHADTTRPRIFIDIWSGAELRYNWWGLTAVPDSASGFCLLDSSRLGLIGSPFLFVNPVHCSEILPQCVIDCGEESPPGGRMQGNLPLSAQASCLTDLPLYAQAGNFSEVYRFIAASAPQVTPAHLLRALSIAMQLECGHARLYPDSAALCLQRFASFVQPRIAAAPSNELRAGLTHLLARASFALGDLQAAESLVRHLRSNWPNSPHASSVLSLMQLIGMALRDTAMMDGAIGAMVGAGRFAEDLRVARSLKRGFLRVLPKTMLPKRRIADHYRANETDAAVAGIGLHHYPNPVAAGQAIISYTLPEASHVTAAVYSMLGRKVATLADEYQPEGAHSIRFAISGHLPSGMYHIVVSTAGGLYSTRMLVRK